ncbi:EAL domain-containing protein [Acetobacterium paludosum]|uniref:EAL domain-containing protein n=1 Tax=Acetobacterium paludosum TaxID=52693 RepID=A0A923HZA5_9FIRM|nr:EAL domain-containing protein [Acetobacterium paludosum]
MLGIWREELRITERENSAIEKELNISEIIQQKSLLAYFQPIMSVTGNKIIGLEGLIRGIIPGTTQIISPLLLFEAGNKEGLSKDLDRACRDKVLAAFKPFYQSDQDLLLFLNLDTSIIDEVGCSNYLNDQVNQNGINVKNIVIEINESKAKNTLALMQFVDTYKNYGFLIALDDVGAGFSNMDRIADLKPDIIKIDRAIVHKMDYIYHKQEVFKSLVNLSNKIGALIIAEGVETKQEAIQVLNLGGQLIQGFYFSKPVEEFVFSEALLEKNIDIVEEYKAFLFRELEDYNRKCLKYSQTVNRMIKSISTYDVSEFNFQLLKCIQDSVLIDCAYVLDESGIQCSETVGAKHSSICEKLVFHSAKIGVDHSIKKYYYNLIRRKQNTYVTEPYVSMATGSLCITYSKIFKHTNKKYILCVDFLEKKEPISLSNEESDFKITNNM